MDKETAIEASNVVFAYHKHAQIIDRLNLSLYKGETAALTGPNGAGKSTLGKLLTGILKPSSGKISLFGENSKSIPLSRIGQKIGYCFQNPEQQLLTVSVQDEIAFGLKYRGVSQAEIARVTESLLTLFEIEPIRHAFPFNLSWGEKRRVVLAACLALEPEYLILDEPTIGLDSERIAMLTQMLGRLREKGVGMLLISHKQGFIQDNAQRILHMKEGKIVDDSGC